MTAQTLLARWDRVHPRELSRDPSEQGGLGISLLQLLDFLHPGDPRWIPAAYVSLFFTWAWGQGRK